MAKPARTARQRLNILEEVFKQGRSVSSVCRESGISRTIFYRWAKRYSGNASRNLNFKNLGNIEREIKKVARRTPYEVIKTVKDFATQNPNWSKYKIAEELKKKLGDKATGVHGVYNILKRIGLNDISKRKEYSKLLLKRYAKRVLGSGERAEMLKQAESLGVPVAQICKEFGISRTCFYKWQKRWREGGENTDTLNNKKPYFDRMHLRVNPEQEKQILSLVINAPNLSKYRLAEKLAEKEGVAVSAHGIYNVLLRNGLNRPHARYAYAQAHLPVTPAPSGFVDRVRSVFEQFVPSLAPAPPPRVDESLRVEAGPPVFSTIFSFLKVFISSAAVTSATLYCLIWWASYVSGQTGAEALGILFASVALLAGSLFFLYSLKYYITLAIVLSFSQTEVTSHRSGGASGTEGKKKGFLSWLLGIGKGNGNGNGNGNTSKGYTGPLGLEPNLEHVVLKRHPYISVHIPLYNEKNVVERIIAAATNFDYKGNYEVILCDDSTDDTTTIINSYMQKASGPEGLKARRGEGWELTWGEVRPGVTLKHLHRTSREGFKGGALRLALKVCDPRTEFVSVFDADFVPYPDTLELFLKYFQVTAGTLDANEMRMEIVRMNSNKDIRINSHDTADSHKFVDGRIAAIQGYQWHVLNKSENWITRGVRSEYAGSYVIERSGTEIYSGLKQISGAVYMIRKDVLEEIGWGTSLTEDFELTLRLYAAGYRVVYTPYIQAPAECVSTIKRLIRQRMRWAEGHSNNIRRMFWRLLFGRWEKISTNNPINTNTTNSQLETGNYPKKWITSPLTLSEKLEFLYLSPYYLQAFFFLVGTLSWLISETIFTARLPFWTSLWGWSLVLTNMLSLPLMNAVGLFLEESEERDYQGIFSFVILSYIMVPFQAYAALKGFLEREEGPWFRTPKTGKITDIFTRGRFYRFISGILPGRTGSRVQGIGYSLNPNPYLSLATANSRFDSFKIRPKRYRFIGNLVLAFALISSIALSYLGANVRKGSLADLPIQTRVEKVGEDSSSLGSLFGVFSPKEVMAFYGEGLGFRVQGLVKEGLNPYLPVLVFLIASLSLSVLISLFKKKRTLFKKIVKTALVFSLIISWLLSGWPVIWKNPRFPPKINTVYAGSQVYSTAQNATTFTVPTGVTSITVKAWGAGGGGGAGAVSVGAGAAGGGGGFAQGTITVTPGEDLNIVMGGGGNGGNGASTRTAGTGGGGNAVTAAGGGTGGNEGDSDGGPGGGGGGYASVKRSTTFLIQAGGGGGAGGGGKVSVGTGGTAGAGGGASGVAGSNAPGGAVGGGAGTASAGGAYGGGGTGGTAGSANTGGNGGFQTGNANGGGGAGGAGRFGGGGGGVNNVEKGGGGGGGGSDLVTGTGTVETAGSGTTPGNNSDSGKTANCSSNGTGGAGGSAGGNGSNGNAGCIILSWTAFNQSAYRFFNNNTANSTDVGTTLAAQDTAASLTSDGQDFRLRLLVHVSDATLALNGQNFKVQIAVRSGTCDTAFSGETYSDLATASGDIRYFDDTDAAKTDGANLTANVNDPTHSSPAHNTVEQDYEEANNFTNTVAAIPSGEDGEWDFSIVDFSAADNTTYCLRVLESGGTSLATYTVIPEFTTVPENGLLMLGLAPMLMGVLKRLRKKGIGNRV